MFKTIQRDLLTVEKGIIAHGCNCSGGFGSGVAGQIKEKWPSVYKAFKRNGTGKDLIGTNHMIQVEDNLWVSNMYTQIFYGKGGRFADPTAIARSLDGTCLFGTHLLLDVYIPKIGSGLGGLDWTTEVLPVVEEMAKFHTSIDIILCEQ